MALVTTKAGWLTVKVTRLIILSQRDCNPAAYSLIGCRVGNQRIGDKYMTHKEIAKLDTQMDAIVKNHPADHAFLDRCNCADAVAFREAESLLDQSPFALTIMIGG